MWREVVDVATGIMAAVAGVVDVARVVDVVTGVVTVLTGVVTAVTLSAVALSSFLFSLFLAFVDFILNFMFSHTS
jgi:hypothetical protein